MPIDRIGKGGGVQPPDVPSVSGPRGAEPTKPFEVGMSAGASPVDAAAGVGPLEQLRAGTIDVDQYVELRIDEATAHLRGLPAAQLDEIRSVLREKLAHDPQLVELVRQATGAVPTPREE